MQKFHILIEHLSRGLSVRFAHNPAIKWSLILFILIIFTGNFGFFIQNAWYFSVGFSVFFALCYRKMQESYNNFLEAHDFLLKIFEKYSHLQNDKVDIYKDSLKLFEIEKKLQKNSLFGKNIAIEGIFELQKFIFEKFLQNFSKSKYNFNEIQQYFELKPREIEYNFIQRMGIGGIVLIIFFIVLLYANYKNHGTIFADFLSFFYLGYLCFYIAGLTFQAIYPYRNVEFEHSITRIGNSSLILFILNISTFSRQRIDTEEIIALLEVIDSEIEHILNNKELEGKIQKHSIAFWEYLKKFSQKNAIELIQILEENLQKNILKEQKILQKSIEDIDSINTKLPVLELQKKRLEMQMQKFQNLTF